MLASVPAFGLSGALELEMENRDIEIVIYKAEWFTNVFFSLLLLGSDLFIQTHMIFHADFAAGNRFTIFV